MLSRSFEARVRDGKAWRYRKACPSGDVHRAMSRMGGVMFSIAGI